MTFTPEEKEVSRQNLRYRDTSKTVSHVASIEGTEAKTQDLDRQKRSTVLRTDLGLIGEDIDVAGRGTNGNIQVAADASLVAAGGLSRRIVGSDGIVPDQIVIQGAPVTTLGGDLFLNGSLGADGAAFAGTGFDGSSIGVGAGVRIADGSIVQNGGETIGEALEGVDGVVTGTVVDGGFHALQGFGGRFGRGFGRRAGFGGRFGRFGGRFGGLAGGVYGRGGYGYAHGW